MEHPQILKRIRENADIILYPELKPFEIKERFGSPCFNKHTDDFIDRYQKGSRSKSTIDIIYGTKKSMFNISKKARDYLLNGEAHRISPKCCKYLKKETAKKYEKKTNKHPIIAVRGSESLNRKARYKTCFSKNGYFHPLYDLNDEMLHAIEEKYGIEVPEIYDHITRTGCMGCPYGHYKGDTEKELRLVNKNQRKFLGEYFKESYEVLGIDIGKIKQECGDYD